MIIERNKETTAYTKATIQSDKNSNPKNNNNNIRTGPLHPTNPNMTLNQHLKHSVFDFTNNMCKNIKTLNTQKYKEDVLNTLSKSGMQRLRKSLAPSNQRVTNENMLMQPTHKPRNPKLYARYNIITNQFQNY